MDRRLLCYIRLQTSSIIRRLGSTALSHSIGVQEVTFGRVTTSGDLLHLAFFNQNEHMWEPGDAEHMAFYLL